MEHKGCHDKTAIRYNKWSSYADGRRGCTAGTSLGQCKSYILVLVLMYKCNYLRHQRCVPLKQKGTTMIVVIIIITTMTTHTEIWTQYRDQWIVGTLAPTDTAEAQLLHLCPSEFHQIGGRNIVRSRVPGSLLWEWLSWKQLHKRDLNNGNITIHMPTRKAANLLESHH